MRNGAGNPDTLICGNCRELFTDLTELLDHKRSYCKLRFTCKCLSTSPVQKVYPTPQAKLVCVACKDSFSNPWDLMVHVQAAHMVNIYELGESSTAGDDAGKTSGGSAGDRTANSTPTMPCSPPSALELGKLNGAGAVAGSAIANGIHELDDDKHDHAELYKARQ
uniref:C2H2-type domain-containing protein n=1 Tax=Anopheles dirus TaxID=7168 RepID=A0A182N970_9DIPT